MIHALAMHVRLIRNAKLPVVGNVSVDWPCDKLHTCSPECVIENGWVDGWVTFKGENGTPAICTEHRAGLVGDNITLVNINQF